MKNALICLPLLFSLFLIGCDDSDDDKSSDPEVAPVHAMINGNSWEASSKNGVHAPVLTTYSNGQTFADGITMFEAYSQEQNGDKQSLLIRFEEEFDGVGTYTGYYVSFQVRQGDSTVTYIGDESDPDNTITFSKYDLSEKRTSGTFSLEVSRDDSTLVFKDGVFTDMMIDTNNM